MLRQLADKLTPFEHSEVLDFPEIWYYGEGAAKIKGMPWTPNNHGACARARARRRRRRDCRWARAG